MEKLLVALKIAGALKELELEIKAAVPGEVVVGPTIKRLRVFGRVIDLPLKPQVIE